MIINSYRYAGGAAPSGLLLDDYPNAAAAYSLRKLRTAYTGAAIRVRESIGNTEADIGFDGSGNLDTVALLAHCLVNDGFVVTWYDQSGNGRDAVQATTANQPRLVNAGALEVINSKPAVNFLNGTTTWLRTASTTGINQPTTAVSVWETPSSAVQILTDGTSTLSGSLTILSNTSIRNYAGASLTLTIADATDVPALTWLLFNSTNSTIGHNGSTLNTGDAGTANMGGVTMGVAGNLASAPYQGLISEHVIWLSDMVASRSGIETEINTHYGIY